jgi:hypothetical protein
MRRGTPQTKNKQKNQKQQKQNKGPMSSMISVALEYGAVFSEARQINVHTTPI